MGLSENDKKFLNTYNADEYQHPSVTVDMLIFTFDIKGDLEILLIKRKHSPFQDCWAIPGGFVEIDESLDDAAARELKEETNIEGVHMEQLYTFGSVFRDPRTRVISVAYLALVPKGTLEAVAGDDAAEAEWFKVRLENDKLVFSSVTEYANGPVETIKYIDLAFDHKEIITTAIERLRGKISYTPIAFQLLNDNQRFSIYELQKVHEAILGKKLDAANFRRSFIANYVDKGYVEETGEECTEFSHRASKYYRYLNKNKEYEEV